MPRRALFPASFRRWLPGLLLAALLPAITACRSLAYYGHVGHGQWTLMQSRRPLSEALDDPALPEDARRALAEVMQARRFASTHLGLPDNGSYTSYVALDHDHVTWNVFATPEFSVSPVTHCFPVAGCVAYRGYFDPGKAQREALRLQARGYQTWIGGAAAYSTLGWFDDPVLSSMLGRQQDDPVAVVFHELEHQQLYVADDTAFNESLASFVQQQGLREWRRHAGRPPPDPGPAERERAFVARVLRLRDALEAIYRSPLDAGGMRARRDEAIAGFREWHAARRESDWKDDARFDAWVASPITNAKLVPFGLYDRWVPAFAVLYARCGRDWPCFHARTAALARRPAAERTATLDALLPPALPEP